MGTRVKRDVSLSGTSRGAAIIGQLTERAATFYRNCPHNQGQTRDGRLLLSGRLPGGEILLEGQPWLTSPKTRLPLCRRETLLRSCQTPSRFWAMPLRKDISKRQNTGAWMLFTAPSSRENVNRPTHRLHQAPGNRATVRTSEETSPTLSMKAGDQLRQNPWLSEPDKMLF